MLGLLRFL